MSYVKDGEAGRGERSQVRGQRIQVQSSRLKVGTRSKGLLLLTVYHSPFTFYRLRFERFQRLDAMRKKVTPSSRHFLTLPSLLPVFPFAGANQVRFNGLPLVATLSFRVVFKLPFSTPNSLHAERIFSDTSWGRLQSIVTGPFGSRK